MYFISSLGVVQGEYQRGLSYPIVFDTNVEPNENVVVEVHNGKIYVGKRGYIWVDKKDSSNIFDLVGSDDFVPTPFDGSIDFKNSELADTEDNPMIVVLTNAIKFYDNTPCLMRVLFINDEMMMAELVYGSCEFGFSDGSFISLQRCDDSNLDTKKVAAVLNCKDLEDRVLNKTKGGWDKKYEMVNSVFIRFDSSGQSSRFRFLKDSSTVFNEEAITAQEDMEEQERLDKIDRIKQKRELAQQHLEEARILHEEQEKRMEAAKREYEENARRIRKEQKRKMREEMGETAPKKTATRSVSAADFLAAVAKR